MRTISKAELARWAGVSRAALTKITRPGALLFDATDSSGVDVDHPLVREWLAGHGVHELPAPRPTVEKRSKGRVKTDGAPTRPPDSPPSTPSDPTLVPPAARSIEDFENLTVREVGMRFGSVDGFKRFVDTLKGIAEYKHRELRVRQQRGELIEREKVRGLVFPLIDVAFARLVSDVPESVTKQVVARVQAGGPDTVADVVHLIREANSRVLKNLKMSAERLELFRDAR